MASYRIEKNAQYNSNEIYFESKPAAEVLTALRGLKMRWNPKKGCWYGFAAQNDILAVIGEHDNELGGTISEGYLGATRWDGNKSGKYLHGAELSKAIREELKAQGIKGVFVSCKTFAGGQEVTTKVKATAADCIGRDEYINDYAAGKYGLSAAWFYTEDGESVHRDKLFSLSNEEQRRIIRSHAAREYDSAVSGRTDINHYRIDDNKIYTEAFRAKLHRINAVLDTFHYDDTNSIVDYFDTNFYYNLQTPPPYDFKEVQYALSGYYMDVGRGAQRAAGAAGRKVGDTDITAMGRRCTHFVPT